MEKIGLESCTPYFLDYISEKYSHFFAPDDMQKLLNNTYKTIALGSKSTSKSDDVIVLLGGFAPDERLASGMFLHENEWRQFTKIPKGTPSVHCGISMVKDGLLLTGGSLDRKVAKEDNFDLRTTTGDGTTANCFLYHLQRNKWKRMSPMHHSRESHCSVTIGQFVCLWRFRW